MERDLEEFWRQQDAIFNMPDETVEEYLERTSTSAKQHIFQLLPSKVREPSAEISSKTSPREQTGRSGDNPPERSQRHDISQNQGPKNADAGDRSQNATSSAVKLPSSAGLANAVVSGPALSQSRTKSELSRQDEAGNDKTTHVITEPAEVEEDISMWSEDERATKAAITNTKTRNDLAPNRVVKNSNKAILNKTARHAPTKPRDTVFRKPRSAEIAETSVLTSPDNSPAPSPSANAAGPVRTEVIKRITPTMAIFSKSKGTVAAAMAGPSKVPTAGAVRAPANPEKPNGGIPAEGRDGKGKAKAADRAKNPAVKRAAGRTKISKFVINEDSTDDSDCERKRAAPPSPPSSPNKRMRVETPGHASGSADQSKASTSESNSESGSTPVVDPLAEFYAQARAERDASDEACILEGSTVSKDEPELPDQSLPIKGKGGTRFACDRKGGPPPKCVNQDIVDKLQQLKELHEAKRGTEERWRVYAYGRAIGALRKYPKRITSYAEARKISGVGEKTAQKIMEILDTGELKRIETENTEDVKVTALFRGIYGVGSQTAFQWYAAGCKTLDDVRARKGGIKVSSVQELGLKYYDDINDRMPRAEAQEIFDRIKAIALQLDSKLFIEIMGSFRRGKADCGDIDILITRPTDDGRTHSGIIRRLLWILHRKEILTEDLSIPDDLDDLECVYRGLCRKDKDSRRRRIDFLTVPWKSRGAALLYYTGDDIFNRAMRLKANVMGYSLNQRGLYAGVVRDPSNRTVKLNEGNIIASETEEEIFRILGVPWQEPHERVRS